MQKNYLIAQCWFILSACLYCSRDLHEQPLMTRASRQMRFEEEMSRYKRVVIRVQFPDRLVMQALFRTTETGCTCLCNWDVDRFIDCPGIAI